MKKAISLFFCVLVLSGCSDPRSKIRGEVLAGCIHSGHNKSICKCGFDKVESDVGDQLETMAPSQFSPLFNKALLECRTGKTSAAPSQSSTADSFKAAIDQALTSPHPATAIGSRTNGQTADGNSTDTALDRAITEQVNLRTKYGGGSEYRDGRRILTGDFNGDQSPDAIVLYTVEGSGGGNASVHTLALFFESQGNYFAQGSIVVDGASEIALDSDGSILVTSLMHGPDDPTCCPSMRSTQQYRVEGNQPLSLP